MIVSYLKADGSFVTVHYGEDAEGFVGPPSPASLPVVVSPYSARRSAELDLHRRVVRHYRADEAGVMVFVSEKPMRTREGPK